jgi:hypothetical protein
VCVRLAQTLNRWWERRGKPFADRFHSHVLRSPTEVHNALAYVLRNAHHHRLFLNGELDPFSSAAWFDGWNRTPRGTTALAPRALLPMAQTWLMTSGWKRLGLLDPGGEHAHQQPPRKQPIRNSHTTRTGRRSAPSLSA